MTGRNLRIAICGGGIAGLVLAITLHRYESTDDPIQVDIYEGDPEVRTAGAGITIWPRTWGVMHYLGLHGDLSDVTVKATGVLPPTGDHPDMRPAFVARKADQSSEGYEYARVLAPSGSTTMHRRDMIDVFLRHLPPSYALHTSKRLVKYVRRPLSSGGALPAVQMHFGDGTTAEADVLVGADGIHSSTRMCMYAEAHNACDGASRSGSGLSSGPTESLDDFRPLEGCARCAAAVPKWTGVHSYRCLIPTDELYALNPNHTTASIGAVLCYSGKGTHIITYQISGGRFLNFVALCRTPGGEGTPYPDKWVIEVSRDEILSRFDGWEPEVQQMLQCVRDPTRWAIHVVDDLPFAVSGNVALVGDAMHAMPPNFGAGGGQAIEDAYILGRLLADPRVSNALSRIPDVLRIYERVRLPFANDVSRRGRSVGLMYEFNAPGLYDGTATAGDSPEPDSERERLDELGAEIERMWQWQWMESFDEQWLQAERELSALLGGRCG